VKEKSRLSKMGHVEFRQALYMPALVAIKHNPIIRNFYERLKARGKPSMVIVCVVMRKLLHMIFGILKNKCVFNPNQTRVRLSHSYS
ncbi:MAG: transposase, partial [Proteobacteria bacterium]|nr:transposase [Pseudomonadota bacterium]